MLILYNFINFLYFLFRGHMRVFVEINDTNVNRSLIPYEISLRNI